MKPATALYAACNAMHIGVFPWALGSNQTSKASPLRNGLQPTWLTG